MNRRSFLRGLGAALLGAAVAPLALPGPVAAPVPLSNEAKAKLISEFLKTPGGRQKLAAAMVRPLKLNRGYVAIARKLLVVEALPSGDTPLSLGGRPGERLETGHRPAA